MNKPWPPVYVLDGSYNVLAQTYTLGTFDASSGRYDPVDQRIELNWLLPPRRAAGMNFIDIPHQLNDGQVNLSNSGAPASNQLINDASLNYLPYHESLHIDFRVITGTITSPWTTLTPTDLNLPGTTPKPNLYAQTLAAYFAPGTGTSTGTYGPLLGPPGVPVLTYSNVNKFVLGNSRYQFRIYLKNKSRQVLASPDYYGTVNPDWNYLYIPDTSGSSIAFGSFGPATAPQRLNIASSNYQTLSISGQNDNPNSTNPVADASLNTPFPSLSLYNLHVNYGFDLSGEKHASSLQATVPPVPYQTFNFTDYYRSRDLTSNQWTFSPDFTTQIPPPAPPPTNLDASLNVAIISNKIVFPGYVYDVSGYYMKLNSDLSYNVYTVPPYGPGSVLSAIVPPPTRSQASTDYTNMLGQGSQSSFFTTGDLVNTQTPAYQQASAWPRGSTVQITNILFFQAATEYELSNSSLAYKLVNKRAATEYPSDIGTALSGNDLCRFSLATTAATPTTIQSLWRRGFVGNDSLNTVTNSFFEMVVSASLDAVDTTTPIPDIYRERGWYLGVDVDNLVVKAISLSNYPDIASNTPAFTDWEIKLTQEFDNANPPVGESDKTVKYDLRIGAKPTQSTQMANFGTTQQLPTQGTSFFGLNRIAAGATITWPVTGTVSQLDANWRPVQSQWLVDGDVVYASANAMSAGDDMTGGDYGQIWPLQHTSPVNMSENAVLQVNSNLTTTYKYSRDRAFTPQFYISGTLRDNVLQVPATTSLASLAVSFNNLPLWWDFTTLNTGLPFTYTLHTPGSGEYPTNYTSPGYSTTYDHADSITASQLMWCKSGFAPGGYSPAAENPYINYSGVFYDQTRDYSASNTTGVQKSLTYTAANDDYYLGGNVTISGTYKWIMLSDVRSGAGDFGKVTVAGPSGTLTLGTDYLLYVQEIDGYFDPANNTLPAGYAAGRSGWKAVQGTWDQGATVQLNNANEAGAYRRNTNTGAVAVHFIKFYSPNANTTVFYRIGLKNGASARISDVAIAYGTN